MKLPQLKKKFLTISELAERWNSMNSDPVNDDRVIAHGEDGSLGMMIVGGRCITWLPETDVNDNFPETPITSEQFKIIMHEDTSSIQLIQLFINDIDNFRNSDIYPARHCIVCDDSIVISMEEIERFENESRKPILPAYLNPDHEYYAKELSIAIEAHTAIFINGEGNRHMAVGERVKTWVSKHYPNESKSVAFIGRISSVVLPKK